ncbi:MAG: ABC transporter ATP-binding protein [Lachnospiraceae bacterium]|nr:ABC transporter ATP-binding protein [Lachnospiraceae bacterium]
MNIFDKKKSEAEQVDIIDLDNDKTLDKNKKLKTASKENKKRKKVLIEFKNVSKKYDQGENVFYALKDASLTINEGEMVVILGPSGAGKSTLLNLLGGMDSASEGHIWFDGEDLTTFSDNLLTKYRAQNVGVVFQFYNLIPTLTAYENVALMKDIKNDTTDPKEALSAVGLAEHMHQFPSQMSGGEQQRTSIARAVAKNPRLLLCDEPTGALDTDTGREVLKLLQDMSREKKRTVVMVTHNSFFADIADTVIRVKNGGIESVVHNDSPKDASVVNW